METAGGDPELAVRIAEIFRLPIRQNSNAIIISHNHPSGDPSPPPEDVSVTRQIVEAHGGTISVSSEEGHGATFTFTLPAQQGQ